MLVLDSEEKSNDRYIDVLSLFFLMDVMNLFLDEGSERS